MKYYRIIRIAKTYIVQKIDIFKLKYYKIKEREGARENS